ncbi:MAG: serpin family protein [Phycisphaerales bacterium]
MDNNIKAAVIGAMVLAAIGMTGGAAGADDATNAHLLAECSNRFGWSLYQQVAAKDGNVLISPHSMHTALAMTYLGARGQTAKQIADAMQLIAKRQSEIVIGPFLLDSYPALLNGTPNMPGIAAKHDEATDKNFRGFTLNSVNAMWAQQGYPFRKEYLDQVNKLFGSGLYEVDFAKNAEAARKTINNWVEQQTNDKIRDLLKPRIITRLTRLVLTNAVYFKAAWAEPFDKKATQDEPFTLSDEKTVNVPMMIRSDRMRYGETETMRAVTLMYEGNQVSMTAVLPREGKTPADVERGLSDEWESLMKNVKQRQVTLVLPKFKFEADYDMIPPLKKLGMVDAFISGKANFAGIDGETDHLYVTAVVQKTFIDVNEEGTEAAAASAVVLGLRGAPAKPIEFRVDQPFVFVIRHEPTGTVLFVGRVNDPRG